MDAKEQPGLLRSLWMPVVGFAVFAGMLVLEPRLLGSMEAGDPRASAFAYTVRIGFWLAAAGLASRLLRVLVWDGLVARASGRPMPRVVADLSTIVLYSVAITIIVGKVFGQPLTGFWATSGVVGLVLGFALRNMILDLFTGVAVNIDQPYKVGDWIQAQDRHPELTVVGQVDQINWRTTRIRTEENNLVVIPNSVLSLMLVTNFSAPDNSKRCDVSVCLDYAVPAERARRVLTAAAASVLERRGFLARPEPDVVIDETTELGVRYLVRFWITPWSGLSPAQARDAMLASVLAHLGQAGLAPAYPKEDVFHAPMPQRQLDAGSERDRAALLARIDLFRPLEPDERAALARAVELRELAAGETLIHAGDEGDSMFLVVEGVLEVVTPSGEAGRELRVATVGPGSALGEMSLLTGERRSATVRALADGVLYEVTKAHVQDLLASRPAIAEALGRVLIERRLANERALADPSGADERMREESRRLLSRIRAFFSGAPARQVPRPRAAPAPVTSVGSKGSAIS